MKRAHRRAHLAIWLLLAPALAAGLIAALSVRTEKPVEPYAPPTAAGAAQTKGSADGGDL